MKRRGSDGGLWASWSMAHNGRDPPIRMPARMPAWPPGKAAPRSCHHGKWMTKVLMVASEATPFAKTGGLADVIGSLPRALKSQGDQPAVVLPLYPSAAGFL